MDRSVVQHHAYYCRLIFDRKSDLMQEMHSRNYLMFTCRTSLTLFLYEGLLIFSHDCTTFVYTLLSLLPMVHLKSTDGSHYAFFFNITGEYCWWVLEEASVLGFKHQGLWSSGKGLSIGTTCQREPGVISSLNPSHQCLTYFLNWKGKAQNLHWSSEFDKDVMSCLWLISIKRWKSSSEWHKKREPPLSAAARDQMWVLRLPSHCISLSLYHS
jgi:hypothetical protein